MRFALRCHADHHTGTGHLVRCLALAEEAVARGHEPVVVGHVGDAPLVRDLLERGVEVRAVGTAPGEADRVAAAVGADLVHVDTYGEVALDGEVPLSNMQDGDYGQRPADLVVDPTLGAELTPAPGLPGRVELRGAAYAPIRKDVASRHAEWRDPSGSRVLVTMGSTDPHDLTSTMVRTLLGTDLGLDLTVIVGRAVPDLTDLVGVTVRPPTPAFADLALEHDLVVSASGTTVSELACLGVPMAVVRAVDNQAGTYAHVVGMGAAWGLGSVDELVDPSRVRELWSRRDGRQELSRLAATMVDGRGAQRIVDVWESLVSPSSVPTDRSWEARPATAADAATLLAWRNDPDTRRASRNPDPVAPKGHLTWLEASLERNDRQLLIVERDGVPVGTVRWDWESDGLWEVSITVAPEARGDGTGATVLARGEDALRRLVGDTVVRAAVHTVNDRSARLFARAGYVRTEVVDADGFRFWAKELSG